jgi:hypothetical protein
VVTGVWSATHVRLGSRIPQRLKPDFDEVQCRS